MSEPLIPGDPGTRRRGYVRVTASGIDVEGYGVSVPRRIDLFYDEACTLFQASILNPHSVTSPGLDPGLEEGEEWKKP